MGWEASWETLSSCSLVAQTDPEGGRHLVSNHTLCTDGDSLATLTHWVCQTLGGHSRAGQCRSPPTHTHTHTHTHTLPCCKEQTQPLTGKSGELLMSSPNTQPTALRGKVQPVCMCVRVCVTTSPLQGRKSLNHRATQELCTTCESEHKLSTSSERITETNSSYKLQLVFLKQFSIINFVKLNLKSP